jgi:Fe-S cluster assembly protein SufD
MFNAATIDQLARRFKEPAWLTELRRKALAKHGELPWPHPSDDIWRRTDVSLLDPSKGFSPTEPSLQQAIALTDEQLAAYTTPLGGETLIVRANGSWISRGAPPPLRVADLHDAVRAQPEPIRALLESDGLTPAEQKLATLNAAFHHDDLLAELPASASLDRPVRLVHLFAAQPRQALFPLTIIRVGAGSRLILIDEYVSRDAGQAQPHLINGRIELLVGPNANVHYVRLQRWSAQAREFLLQRATLAEGATLTMANINMGAALSKAHIVTKFIGSNASSQLYGFVFGHHAQHIDQHTLQDHQAPHTTSDLHFRAALQDESRMIYTGLIRIAKEAKQTNAFQANHNLLLTKGAQAETIPMLEILADDVQCKHGASVGPIDEEMLFYSMTRGVPRPIAERLIVMGFVEPMIQQVPFEPLQERLRQEIEGGLHENQ